MAPGSGAGKQEYRPKRKEDEEEDPEALAREAAKKASLSRRGEFLERRQRKNALTAVESEMPAGEIGLSEAKMDELDLFQGDVVKVKGQRGRWTLCVTTVEDVEDGECLLSRSSLKNCRGRDGEFVKVRAAECKYAARLHLLPFRDTLRNANLDDDPEEIVTKCLRPYFSSRSFTAVAAGDRLEIPVEDSGAIIEFHVADVDAVDEDSVEAVLVRQIEEEESEEAPSVEFALDPEYYLERKDDERVDEIGFEDLGGVARAVATVRELVETPLKRPEIFQAVGVAPPRGVLLYGPPGCGKTSIARALADETGAYFFVINGAEILSARNPGEAEENLRKAFTEARKNAPAIIFVDEIDALAPRKDAKAQGGGTDESRATRALCDLLDELASDYKEAAVVVIAATNRPNAVDAALRRFGRLDREVDVGVPDVDARLDILAVRTRTAQLADDVNLETVAKSTHGFVGADLAQLCLEAAFDAVKEHYLATKQAKLKLIAGYGCSEDEEAEEPKGPCQIAARHFLTALDRVNPSALRETAASLPKASWADVGGLEDVKRELYETVQFPVEHGDKYRKFGLPPSRGVLFYGPPGCGKTLLAQAVARECGANFVSIKGPELLTMWFGESEANVRDLFDKARQSAPCILFFDEIDAIAKQRGSGAGGASEAGDRVINQILTEIDGVGARKDVFVIGATNRPEVLDAAITRPGRLDTLVYIPLPDTASRASIFKATLRKSPVADDVDLEVLAKHTPGFSGADVAEVCKRAARYAIRDAVDFQLDSSKPEPQRVIQRKHFEMAMGNARRSVTDTELQKYDAYAAKAQRKPSSKGSSPLSGFKFQDNHAEVTSEAS